MKIYPIDKIFEIKFAENVYIKVKQLSLIDRTNIYNTSYLQSKDKTYGRTFCMTVETLRVSLQEIKGLKYDDGRDFVLKKDKQGQIKDESLSELLNCFALSRRFLDFGNSLTDGIPEKMYSTDIVKGIPVPLEDYEILKDKSDFQRSKKK